MAEEKYYDYLKPKLPPMSFSDVVNQQVQIVEQQRRQRAAYDMQLSKARQKQVESQQKQTLGFDVSDLSEVDKNTFSAKRDWLKGRIDNYYYTGGNTGEFVEDVNALKNLHAELKNHHENTKSSRNNLEGWVVGTKDWTNQDLDLKDDLNTFNQKRMMWEMSGIDPTSVRVDPTTGDTYAYYTDINGNRLKGADGKDMFGLAYQSPTRGSQEYFSPTSTPYDNLLPGKFSTDFYSRATALKNNQDMTFEQKQELLRKEVTAAALANKSVGATATNVFNEKYGGGAQAALAVDAQNDPGDGSYVPLPMRDYIDQTMRFLQGKFTETDDSGSGSGKGGKVFPSSMQFRIEDFSSSSPTGPTAPGRPSDFGAGITNLMVPKPGVGGSSVMVQRSYQPQSQSDPRFNEVSDQYKVQAVAIEEGDGKNLFVQAEMYFQVGDEELPPELAARRANLAAMGFDVEAAKVSRVKKTVPIVVSPTTLIDGQVVRNPEYLSLLAQIAYAKGYKIDDQLDAAAKGMDILQMFNDQQAEIAAALPTN